MLIDDVLVLASLSLLLVTTPCKYVKRQYKALLYLTKFEAQCPGNNQSENSANCNQYIEL